MHMLRHHHLPSHHKTIADTHRFKLALKDTVCRSVGKQWLTTITTESEKVKAAALLVSDKLRHDGESLHPVKWLSFVVSHPSLEKSEGWGTQFIGQERMDHPPILNRNGFECTSQYRPAACCGYCEYSAPLPIAWFPPTTVNVAVPVHMTVPLLGSLQDCSYQSPCYS